MGYPYSGLSICMDSPLLLLVPNGPSNMRVVPVEVDTFRIHGELSYAARKLYPLVTEPIQNNDVWILTHSAPLNSQSRALTPEDLASYTDRQMDPYERPGTLA